jgi:hypothetical protein
MIKVILKRKNNRMDEESQTKGECEKKSGSFCYMIQKPVEKTKTVELEEILEMPEQTLNFNLTSREILTRNRIALKDYLKNTTLENYEAAQEALESYYPDQLDKEMESPSFMRRFVSKIEYW